MILIQNEPKASRKANGWARFAAITAALFCLGVSNASAETRALKIHHLHTGEKAEIVFKRNGRYDAEGLKKINFILRDWRRNEPTKMDPRLLDLVWQAYRASGSREYLKVVSGYRAPATNAMLRSRSKGVAKTSQHMVGKAMDFFLPDVPLKKLRNIALKMQAGGVGFYPTSGSPFIHLDVGNVRHWPGISRQELAGLFPDGKTLHVPSDGKPLPGYGEALAAYKSRQASGAPAIALASVGDSPRKKRGLLATLFGGGAEEADDMADVASAAPVPRKAVKSAPAPKAPEPKAIEPAPLPGIAIVAPDKAQRTEIPTVVEQVPAQEIEPDAPETVIAALSGSAVPLPEFAPRRAAGAVVAAAVAADIPTPETMPFGFADRSAAPVEVALADPTPDAVPFGQADASVSAYAAAEPVALNIPLPTRRPDYRVPSIAQVESASADEIGALLAMNQPDDETDRLAAKLNPATAGTGIGAGGDPAARIRRTRPDQPQGRPCRATWRPARRRPRRGTGAAANREPRIDRTRSRHHRCHRLQRCTAPVGQFHPHRAGPGLCRRVQGGPQARRPSAVHRFGGQLPAHRQLQIGPPDSACSSTANVLGSRIWATLKRIMSDADCEMLNTFPGARTTFSRSAVLATSAPSRPGGSRHQR